MCTRVYATYIMCACVTKNLWNNTFRFKSKFPETCTFSPCIVLLCTHVKHRIVYKNLCVCVRAPDDLSGRNNNNDNNRSRISDDVRELPIYLLDSILNWFYYDGIFLYLFFVLLSCSNNNKNPKPCSTDAASPGRPHVG